jgi:hypothetical protein
MVRESKSLGWIREGTLWTYQKPEKELTGVEACLEASRQHKELKDKWRKRLGEEPFHCPECGSGNFMEWLIGWWPSEDHYHDPNRKECMDCGHWWWIVCPTCGHNKGRTKENYFQESEKYVAGLKRSNRKE